MASAMSWHAQDSWHDINLSPELQHCQIQRSRGCTTGNYPELPEPPSSAGPSATAPHMQSDIVNTVHDGCAQSEGQSDTHSSQQTTVQALLISAAPPAPEDIATVSSVLQRMVDVVIFRAASELQPGLIEQMEAHQEALWESEFQAQEWQQQLHLQRVRARPSLQRFGPSRSISLPSTSQQYQAQLTRAKTGTHSHASSYTKQSNTSLPATLLSPLPTVSENVKQSDQQCQPVSPIPLIKVPSSTSEAHAHSAASTVAVANSDRSGTCAAPASDASPEQPRASSCSSARPAQRRASDLGLPASKACHRLKKAPPGNSHTASLHRPAVCNSSHTSKSKQQPEVVVTAEKKAGPMACVPGLSAGGKGKVSGDVRPLSQGVGGKPAQVSPSARSSGPSFSRPQSLLTTRSHLKAIPNGPVLLNNVASPQSTHGHHSSSRDFFSQPSPGAILANGAPAGLQKAIVELMRRQSDTVKWEQKSSRACEHRSGVASHRLSDAVLL
ncbi:TPA: hypothetical protein ACH3X2_009152 [Trebouxia sp. C0005]